MAPNSLNVFYQQTFVGNLTLLVVVRALFSLTFALVRTFLLINPPHLNRLSLYLALLYHSRC